MNTLQKVLAVTLLAGMALGCRKETHDPHAPEDGSGREVSSAAALPPGLLLAQEPEGVQGLVAALTSAKDGEQVTLRGRVGGRRAPFVSGRAVMVLVDLSVPYCGENGDDDHCRTPWDYCCEPADHLAKHAVTVQVVDQNGEVLRADLNGAGGLAPLRKVAVQGTLRQDGSGGRTVQATGIYVMPQ